MPKTLFLCFKIMQYLPICLEVFVNSWTNLMKSAKIFWEIWVLLGKETEPGKKTQH